MCLHGKRQAWRRVNNNNLHPVQFDKLKNENVYWNFKELK